MRPRFSRALAACFLVLLAASGCAKADLTSKWPGFAEPTGWEPKVGACTHSFFKSSGRPAYLPVECTTTHVFETVHLGQLKGDAAAQVGPPEPDSSAWAAVWAECDTKTTEYLGGKWLNARIWMGISMPTNAGWDGGARWFRCEAAVAGIGTSKTTTWSKSLKGELAASEALLRTCVQIFDDDTATRSKDCGEPHNGEFVGQFVYDGTYRALENDEDAVHKRCRSLVAAYVGVPDDRNLEYRTGTSYSYPTASDWAAGDHLIQCRLYLDRNVSKSLKGGGTKALPI